jgi:hypothetical protein
LLLTVEDEWLVLLTCRTFFTVMELKRLKFNREWNE